LPDVVGAATQAGTFSTLLSAATAAGLVDTLQSDTITLFAPTDEAFAAANVGGRRAEELAEVLKYHIVMGRLDAKSAVDIAEGSNPTLATLQGAPIQLSVMNGNLYVNGAMVTSADIAASNGVIHVIDAVLSPPEPCLMRANAEPIITYIETQTSSAQGYLTAMGALGDAYHKNMEGTITWSISQDESNSNLFREVQVFSNEEAWLNHLRIPEVQALLQDAKSAMVSTDIKAFGFKWTASMTTALAGYLTGVNYTLSWLDSNNGFIINEFSDFNYNGTNVQNRQKECDQQVVLSTGDMSPVIAYAEKNLVDLVGYRNVLGQMSTVAESIDGVFSYAASINETTSMSSEFMYFTSQAAYSRYVEAVTTAGYDASAFVQSSTVEVFGEVSDAVKESLTAGFTTARFNTGTGISKYSVITMPNTWETLKNGIQPSRNEIVLDIYNLVLPLTRDQAISEGWVLDVAQQSWLQNISYGGHAYYQPAEQILDPNVIQRMFLLYREDGKLSGMVQCYGTSSFTRTGPTDFIQLLSFSLADVLCQTTILRAPEGHPGYRPRSINPVGDDVWYKRNDGEIIQVYSIYQVDPVGTADYEFTPSNCLPGMGLHWWPDQRHDDCADIMPFFAMHWNNSITTIGSQIWSNTVEMSLYYDQNGNTAATPITRGPTLCTNNTEPIYPDCMATTQYSVNPSFHVHFGSAARMTEEVVIGQGCCPGIIVLGIYLPFGVISPANQQKCYPSGTCPGWY